MSHLVTSRQPIRKPTDKNLLYLLEFAAWVKEWYGQTKLSLTQQTTTAVKKNFKCQDCKDLYIASDEVPALTFVDDGNGDSTTQDAVTRAAILKQVNSRGGLCTLTDLVYISCIYIWNFYQT